MIQPQPKELIRFKRVTHAVYTAYSMSNFGMQKVLDELSGMKEMNPEGLFQIGETSDSKRKAISEIQTKDALIGLAKNGPFSQLIAFGMITWTFAMWEEEYRQKIADELNVQKSDILCDVMGDLRFFRNWIVHNNGVANKDVKKLISLNWLKKDVPIIITDNEMATIQESINTMQVYLK
jgi:hypothetical protein